MARDIQGQDMYQKTSGVSDNKLILLRAQLITNKFVKLAALP